MSDNSFERHIQQEFTSFHLTPSGRVWCEVEKKLKASRKKRRGFIWLFSGLLLIGAGSLWYYGLDKQQAVSLYHRGMVSTVPANQYSNEPVVPDLKNRQDQNKQMEQGPADAETKIKQSATGMARKIPAHPEKRNHVGPTDDQAAFRENPPAQVRTEPLPPAHAMQTHEAEKTQAKILTSEEDETEPLRVKKPGALQQDSGALAQSSPIQPNPPAEVPGTAPAPQKPVRITGWNLRWNLGWSGLSDGFISVGQKSSAADYSNSPGSSTGGQGSAQYAYTQANSLAWGAGLVMNRPLGRKTTLNAGIVYRYYSTSSKVGSQYASAITVNNGIRNLDLSSYYSSGSQTTYTNRYHLVELPLEVNVLLNRNKRAPLSWHAGISPGYMAGSNAMIQDTSGIIYKDASNYNRFQIGLLTGLQIRLFPGSSHALELGPVFQYQLTPAFKPSTGANGNLFFLGLQGDLRLFNSGQRQR